MQKGNVILYVLIAVALLAALSIAVSQTGPGNLSTLTTERSRLYATQIIEYANALSVATAQLRLRGVAETDLCFDDDSWPAAVDYSHAGCSGNSHKIFHEDGGGVVWQAVPSDAQIASPPRNYYIITSGNVVNNVGTSTEELILFAPYLSDAVCIQINKELGISSADTVITTGYDEVIDPFQGSYSPAGGTTIGFGGDVFSGQKAGCYHSSPNDWTMFYRVLLAR